MLDKDVCNIKFWNMSFLLFSLFHPVSQSMPCVLFSKVFFFSLKHHSRRSSPQPTPNKRIMNVMYLMHVCFFPSFHAYLRATGQARLNKINHPVKRSFRFDMEIDTCMYVLYCMYIKGSDVA